MLRLFLIVLIFSSCGHFCKQRTADYEEDKENITNNINENNNLGEYNNNLGVQNNNLGEYNNNNLGVQNNNNLGEYNNNNLGEYNNNNLGDDPNKTTNNEIFEQCPICIEKYDKKKDREKIVFFNCLHFVCKRCLPDFKENFGIFGKCPTCKKGILLDEKNAEELNKEFDRVIQETTETT